MAVVWQLSIITLSSKSLIKGVILKSNPFYKNGKFSVLDNLTMLMKSYFTSPVKNSEICIELENKTYSVVTNNHGMFELKLDITFRTIPRVHIWFQNTKLNINQDYPVFFKNETSKIAVISDIDDTILVSHTANAIKCIKELSLVPPHKRESILLTKKLLNLINKIPTNIFYVSKSESNLFKILYSFIIKNNLPKGVLLLTPYLNFKQLLYGKKADNFKLNIIEFILENSPDKKFILFGDDTQNDIEIYTSIVKLFPNKIERIYIHQTIKSLNKQKKSLMNTLQKIFAATVYFNESTDLKLELRAIENLIKSKTF
jgi:phosphatidate phosphatase APP1